MVIIKTTCPTCGEVDLTADKIALRIAVNGKGSAYTFECPSCREHVRKPADSRVVQLLISGGVAPEVVSEGRGAAGIEESPAGGDQHPARATRNVAPAITYDDILEFHRELEDGVLEAFLHNASVQRP